MEPVLPLRRQDNADIRSWPSFSRLLVVSAHPDDESFGLGGILAGFAARGTELTVLCFTHGEQSTLGVGDHDLAALRRYELATAAKALGIARTRLLSYPDGGLREVPLDELVAHVLQAADGVDALLVFDEGGITGHPDHIRATQTALAAAAMLRLPVLTWAIPRHVADALNREYGTTFVGRQEDELDVALTVDRTCQLAAIRCHHSQSHDNPVLWRRLALQGTTEWLRLLRPGGEDRSAPGEVER